MFNLTVTKGTYRQKDSPKIGKKMLEERRARQKAEMDKKLDAIAEKEQYKRTLEAHNKSIVDQYSLERAKLKCISRLGRLYPNLIMSEAYAMIVSNSLPHDEEFVQENFSSILANEFIYLHNIGGYQLLKKKAFSENSNFLKKMYRIVTENSKDILERKIHEIQKAKDTSELHNVSVMDLTDEEHGKVSKDLSTLTPDELTNLINKKVVQVVKDESDREKKNKEYIDNIKEAVAEKEKKDAEKAKAKEKAKDEDEDEEEDTTEEEPADEDKKEPEKAEESNLSAMAKLSKYILNRGEIGKTSLFGAMMYRNTKYFGKLKSVMEDAVDDKQIVYTSPLNMNTIDIYLKDTSGDLANIDFLKTTITDPLGGDDVRLDESDIDLNNSFESILSETIVQYTMLEAVVTTKLVSVSRDEIKEFTRLVMKR